MQILYFTEDIIQKVIDNLKKAGIPEQDVFDPSRSGFIARTNACEKQEPCIAISTDYFMEIIGGGINVEGFEEGSII